MLKIVLPFSLLALAAALLVPGYSDFALLLAPVALAALFLLVWGRFAPDRHGKVRRKASGLGAGPHVVIDGSNVMHWGGSPDLATVSAVVKAVAAQGFTPGVIFDANAGYKIGDRYQDDRELARKLGLPEDRVLVVPKGTIADQYILTAARDIGAKVVTNDRYRDWSEAFPEVVKPGFLLRGGVKDGKVWLA